MSDYPDYKNILVDRWDEGVTITFNRPDVLNPLDWDTLAELRDIVALLEKDHSVRTVVFTGEGRAFSAGGDLDKYMGLFSAPEDFRFFVEQFYKLFEVMENSAKIFVAAINGLCVAGGLELLLACDLVIASEDAKIGDGHLNFGMLPGAGSSIRLWRAVGAVHAKHLFMTGDMITAKQAFDMGLVGEVTPAGKLEEGYKALAAKLHAKSPTGMKGGKFLMNEAIRSDLERALRVEISYVVNYATTESDPIEGLMAFKEKRKPQFKKLG